MYNVVNDGRGKIKWRWEEKAQVSRDDFDILEFHLIFDELVLLEKIVLFSKFRSSVYVKAKNSMMSKSTRSSWKHRAATTGSVQFKWKDLTGDRYPATDMLLLLPPFPRRRDTSPIFGDTGTVNSMI